MLAEDDDGGVGVPRVDKVARDEIALVANDPALWGGVDHNANAGPGEYCVWAHDCMGGRFEDEWFVGDHLDGEADC